MHQITLINSHPKSLASENQRMGNSQNISSQADRSFQRREQKFQVASPPGPPLKSQNPRKIVKKGGNGWRVETQFAPASGGQRSSPRRASDLLKSGVQTSELIPPDRLAVWPFPEWLEIFRCSNMHAGLRAREWTRRVHAPRTKGDRGPRFSFRDRPLSRPCVELGKKGKEE